MNYASFGSISHGTMRNEDLLDTFASELQDHVQRNAAEWCSDDGRAQRDRLVALCEEANETDCESDDYDDDAAGELVEALFEALNEFAPPYAYFGAHEGDGSDYGYWLIGDMQDDFDGLQVADTSEVPNDYVGEVLHVNDHGNMTLYTADAGKLTEVWSLV